jgi:hypothetical protein
VCREFFCNWLLIDALGPEWQPERSKIVLQSVALAGGHQGLSVHADPDFPENWRLPPYYTKIKAWAAKAAQNTKQTGPIYFVVAEVDLRKFLILPDRDVDLGVFQDKESIEIERQVRNGHAEITARKSILVARLSSFSQGGAHISLRPRWSKHLIGLWRDHREAVFFFALEDQRSADQYAQCFADHVAVHESAVGPSRHFAAAQQSVAFGVIVLQKSKVAALRIFRENTKRESIADSYNLNRVTEVACEINVGRRGPSHLYTKAAPVARRIFDHQCKTTFATQSGGEFNRSTQHSSPERFLHWEPRS